MTLRRARVSFARVVRAEKGTNLRPRKSNFEPGGVFVTLVVSCRLRPVEEGCVASTFRAPEEHDKRCAAKGATEATTAPSFPTV